MTANKITMKHTGDSSRYTVELSVNGKSAIIVNPNFYFASSKMINQRTKLGYDELSRVLDVAFYYQMVSRIYKK